MCQGEVQVIVGFTRTRQVVRSMCSCTVHITGLTGLALGFFNAVVSYTRGFEYALAVKFERIVVLCEDVYVLHGSRQDI